MFAPLTADGWEDGLTTWPLVDLGKIFHYIISKKAFEADYVGQYKVKKAFSYFNSGFVSQIVSKNLSMNDETRIVLKVFCLAIAKGIQCKPLCLGPPKQGRGCYDCLLQLYCRSFKMLQSCYCSTVQNRVCSYIWSDKPFMHRSKMWF